MGVSPSALHPPIRPERLPIQDPLPPAHERTVFLVFSKGYKVSEPELREFITLSFGDIIESLNMLETRDDQQPLFAQLVLYSKETIHWVLNGGIKAKFTFNGKHVYVRKLVRAPRTNTSTNLSS